MGEMDEFRGKLKAIIGGVEEEEENLKYSSIFPELKHYCIQLLDVLQNPNKIPSSTFSQLLILLQRSSPDSVQPFFDYALFPLLLLLDAAVNCRTSQKANSENRLLSFHALETPHSVSDAVAEATPLCLEELLKKCRLGSVDQMVVILKKLTHGALLSASEASEEFRGVIRCFKALLLNLHSCSDESCLCKQIGGCPPLLGRDNVRFSCAQVLKYDLVPDQCLLAFLQSEPASAIVGHWLSLLLKAADVEATRGRRGSSGLRVESFIALRELVAKTIRRCCRAISTVVQICGGEFFSRRFHADGIHLWKLLNTSPFQKRPFSREERTPLQLPYRSISTSSEDSVAEISSLKVQAELLNMISNLARNKRSASALEAVFKKVSGLVVGIACSGVKCLLDASVNALIGLAYVDTDLIWLLISDVYYSRKRDLPLPPTSEFPDITEILPPPSSSKEYLYVLYGGQSYGFDIDFTSVETVFKKLHTQVFTQQIYS